MSKRVDVPEPPPEALAWIERSVGNRARVVACERLTGGIVSAVHAVTVEVAGDRMSYVLRRHTGKHGLAAIGVDQEAAILSSAAGAGLPAPEVVAVSPAGAGAGGLPALLMTRLPGRVYLTPVDLDDWLGQLAQTLARIHAADVDAPAFDPGFDARKSKVPESSIRPDVWRAAIDAVRTPGPQDATAFTHGDYQHFNILWTDERLSGVCDWAGASLGPPDLDVGHCSLNLAILFSAGAAEKFRSAYEAEAGRPVSARWQIEALLRYGPGWRHFIPIQVDGRAAVDGHGMDGRVEELMTLALNRL